MTALARATGFAGSSSTTTAAARVFEYLARVYRRSWRGSAFSTFLTPILFLSSMGLGLGGFVDRNGTVAALGGVSYAAFLAPGLLASQAMQTGSSEAAWPVMGRIVWDRIYHGMLATPITVPGIVLGQLAWIGARLVIVATVFFVVMIGFGLVVSPLGLLGIPAAVLTGLAFAAPVMAFTASRRNDSDFNLLFRFVITPLFIFSGTFFPIEQLPAFIRPVAWLTPTWHGVMLARGLSLGTIDLVGAAVHVTVLLAFIAGGLILSLISFRRTLVR